MFDLFDFDGDGIVDSEDITVGMLMIEEAGLDYKKLKNMDKVERARVLREAGLDPDDFDF